MDTGPEKVEIGTAGKASVQDGDELAEGPNTSSEKRLRTPARPLATKRKTGIHHEEPDVKKIVLDDDEASDGENQ